MHATERYGNVPSEVRRNELRGQAGEGGGTSL